MTNITTIIVHRKLLLYLTSDTTKGELIKRRRQIRVRIRTEGVINRTRK